MFKNLIFWVWFNKKPNVAANNYSWNLQACEQWLKLSRTQMPAVKTINDIPIITMSYKMCNWSPAAGTGRPKWSFTSSIVIGSKLLPNVWGLLASLLCWCSLNDPLLAFLVFDELGVVLPEAMVSSRIHRDQACKERSWTISDRNHHAS